MSDRAAPAGGYRHLILTGVSAGIGAAAVCVMLWIVLHRHPRVMVIEEAVPEPGARVEAEACWFEVPAGRAADCGALVLPASVAGQESRLRYVVFKAAAPAEPDPIVYVNGGPGDPVGLDPGNIRRWWEVTHAALWMQHRDVVIYDQRGVGVSTPRLDCPELSQAGGRLFVERLAPADSAGIWRDAASACRERLAQQGLKLDTFNTESAVADLELLLDGLGYRAWNLYGVSYGTRVVLNFMRTAGAERTRSVILDSVYPPDVEAYLESGTNAKSAFEQLEAHCAADHACSAANPHLAEALDRALRIAGTAGFVVPVGLPGEAPKSAAIDGGKLVEILFYGLYRWSDIRRLPAVITALSQGDAQPLVPLAQSAYETAASPESGYGAYLTSECRDEYPFNPPDELEKRAAALPAYRDFMLADLPVVACPVWPMGQAASWVREKVYSDLPVLLLAGDVDPITPPAWARRAAATLPHGTLFVFPGIGHGVVAAHACASRLAAAFLADPDRKPYAECLLGLG